MVKELRTVDEFNAFLEQHPKCIIDFGATWCGPCKKIAPFFDTLSTKYEEISFAKVDVDTPELEPVVNQLVKDGIPLFIAFQNSTIIDEVIGASEPKLSQMAYSLAE